MTSSGKTLTRSGNSLGHSSMLTSTAMVLTVSLIDETWHKTIVHTSTQALVETDRNKFITSIMELIESYNINFARNLSVKGLSPSVSKIICPSQRSSLKATYNTSMQNS